jgi:hypothetical protein
MHAYEMSYKCQLYPIHTVAIRTYLVAILGHNHFESPNIKGKNTLLKPVDVIASVIAVTLKHIKF